MGNVSTVPSTATEDGSPMPARPCDLAGLPTRAVLEAAVDSGYTGDAWEELARRLAVRALPGLERFIRSGAIVERCRRAGLGIRPRPELQSPPVSEDIAAEAVERASRDSRPRCFPLVSGIRNAAPALRTSSPPAAYRTSRIGGAGICANCLPVRLNSTASTNPDEQAFSRRRSIRPGIRLTSSSCVTSSPASPRR